MLPTEKRLLELLRFSYEWIGTCGCANRGAHDGLLEWLASCERAFAYYKEIGED